MLDLISNVFKELDTDRLLKERKRDNTALNHLVQSYAEYSSQSEAIPDMTDASTGRELIAGIRTLSKEQQVSLSYQFLRDRGSLDDDDGSEEKEDRNMRIYLMKTLVGIVACVSLMLLGAAIFITFHQGCDGPAGKTGMVEHLLDVASGFLKIILSLGE